MMASIYSTVLPQSGDIVPAVPQQAYFGQNASTSWSDVLNESGSGYLLSIQGEDADDIRLRVTIDGMPSAELAEHVVSGELLLFSGPARFRTSLRVEVRRNSGTSFERVVVRYSLEP